MAGESIIFEIQVEKKILEQVLNENKYLKENYDKIVRNGDEIKTLKREIVTLRNEIEKLHEENTKLKTIIKSMESNEYNDLGKHVNQYIISLMEEFSSMKQQLLRLQTENRQLDKDNLNLETQVKNLTKKLRLEEERNKSNDLAHMECKLLKLKLHTIENEKKYLLEEFEKERKIITKQNKPRVAKLEENIKHLRKWIEKEAKERRPRDSEEVKSLKAQIHELENDKTDLIEGFELERKVFRKIIKANGNDLP